MLEDARLINVKIKEQRVRLNLDKKQIEPSNDVIEMSDEEFERRLNEALEIVAPTELRSYKGGKLL